jgi:peptide/nickel transport system ATP-binding protein
MTPAIDATGVSASYGRPSFLRRKMPDRVLRDVTIKVESGTILGVVGGSGSGKSTLASVLLRLIEPMAGTILVNGRDLTSYSRRELSRVVQPVFQDPASTLNPKQRIGDILRFPLDVHGLGTRAARKDLTAEYMELVGLRPSQLTSYPHMLSGGQRQRVSIARALILQPEILICDEPTSALDVSVQSQVLNLLAQLQSQRRLTVVFISHNIDVVSYLADTVAVMLAGEIVEIGATASVLGNPQHPYTKRLLASIL